MSVWDKTADAYLLAFSRHVPFTMPQSRTIYKCAFGSCLTITECIRRPRSAILWSNRVSVPRIPGNWSSSVEQPFNQSPRCS